MLPNAASEQPCCWHEAPGSYATQVVVNTDNQLRVPEGVSAEVTAAIPLPGLTVQHLATSSHEIKPGQTALVHAGDGGVGLFLTQIIKHLGRQCHLDGEHRGEGGTVAQSRCR